MKAHLSLNLHSDVALMPSSSRQVPPCSSSAMSARNKAEHHTRMHLCRSLRTRTFRSKAWQSWWREERPSTFNAIVARDCPPTENGRTSSGGGGLPNGGTPSRLGSSCSTPRSELATLHRQRHED